MIIQETFKCNDGNMYLMTNGFPKNPSIDLYYVDQNDVYWVYRQNTWFTLDDWLFDIGLNKIK